MADKRFTGQGLRRLYSKSGLSPYGIRHDGSAPKGKGYFGEITNSRGGHMTEFSMTVPLFGRKREIPLIVPTLTADEINVLKKVENGEIAKVPNAIRMKAIDHAESRIKEGKSPFAAPTELRVPKPNDDLKQKIKNKMRK